MRRILGVLTALVWRVLGAMALEHTGHCHALALILMQHLGKADSLRGVCYASQLEFSGCRARWAAKQSRCTRQMIRCAALERTGRCHRRARPVTCGHHTGRRRSRWQTYERSGRQLCCTIPVRFRQWTVNGVPPPLVHYGARKRRSDRPGSF